ncbi:bifunctional phosphopantothenoylcysteine decarboxylase/phosphopantothenate--cysteine ligase CoaBC [Olivibacter sitiensis]|uniref:bifunctional phosphopantothenoylcysteine decarboxylase/phosphopantothenate--cysteine ligase CoaBC n=1 Tax=Olivibacter sitiensis TaxID=376470 RepID=UPI000481F0A8|nr:bifunctional phosphopantothenoylcysteine decarboxylase/phosphopantothenate--cysteine ligase CoaBC [Olivibacter sitiensis]
MLKDKKILLGVCGGIAAYKTSFLIRLLIKEGAQVQVVMTPEAQQFITSLTLSTLSKRPVLTAYYDPENGEWNNHVELALWADLLVIAPATANTLAKMAHGLCDNLLLAIYLSAKCPVCFAPAMDLDMWIHPTTKSNVALLQGFAKHHLIPPGTGELASGLSGEGRLAEPEEIIQFLIRFFDDDSLPLSGKNILVSAGPTYEAIDPVRFIGNHSSGKMGYAIAKLCAQLGASVTLVSGPTNLPTPKGCHRIDVTSAGEMLTACLSAADGADIIIMSAAVADYTPAKVSDKKIKKTEDLFEIKLKKTTDILAELGKRKKSKQLLAGFALETDNEEDNALSKLKRKNLDFIVLNSLRDKGAGFSGDTNKVTILDKQGNKTELPLKSKEDVAKDIIDYAIKLIPSTI